MARCQGQWRAGPMNRIIFQPDGTRMVPIFSPGCRVHYAQPVRAGGHLSIVLSEPQGSILRGIAAVPYGTESSQRPLFLPGRRHYPTGRRPIVSEAN